MQNERQTAGKTAKTITLVAIIDCHASHNVRLENVRPEEKGYIKRFLKSQGYQVVERKPKPQEPTCDNCGNMSIRQGRDGENHRICDLRGCLIPDDMQSPTCDLHTALQRFNDIVVGRRDDQPRENTLKTKGGRK